MAQDTHDGRYGTLGIIGRFQPVHIGHERLLSAARRRADTLLVGIGGVNRHDARHPFSPLEVREMLDRVLRPMGGAYKIVEIPDYGHLPGCEDGSCWHAHMCRAYEGIDALVSGNPYVRQLLDQDFRLLSPEDLIEDRHPICGSLVRAMIAHGYGWNAYVPTSIAMYIGNLAIDARVCAEFGKELRASFPKEVESLSSEVEKVRGQHTSLRNASMSVD